MPDKIQHTAVSMQQKMLLRYNDGLHHKHNKNHLAYRKHYRSPPCDVHKSIDNDEEQSPLNQRTGTQREFGAKKIRTRKGRGIIH